MRALLINKMPSGGNIYFMILDYQEWEIRLGYRMSRCVQGVQHTNIDAYNLLGNHVGCLYILKT